MKWHSTKKYKPSFEGYYICRCKVTIDDLSYYEIIGIYYERGGWLMDRTRNLTITHFSIPGVIEVEE